MWTNIQEQKPKPLKTIEYKTYDGHTGEAYLCKCGHEWRCVLSGYGLLINVKEWRYV